MAARSPVNSKIDLMSFCSRKRIQPEFRKQSTIQGCYKSLVMVSIPLVASDEIEHFEAMGTGTTKKEAEDEASCGLLQKLNAFFDDYSPPDISTAKQQLLQFIQTNKRFCSLTYEPDSILSPSFFRFKVEVVDNVLGGKVYTTVGQAIGKKDAEKDGAYRMLKKLEEVIQSSQSENKIESLDMAFESQFPDYQLKYAPFTSEDKSETLLFVCRLLVLKDNVPRLTVAVCTGSDQNAAKDACAQIFLLHLGKIKKKLEI